MYNDQFFLFYLEKQRKVNKNEMEIKNIFVL